VSERVHIDAEYSTPERESLNHRGAPTHERIQDPIAWLREHL